MEETREVLEFSWSQEAELEPLQTKNTMRYEPSSRERELDLK